MRSKDLKLHAFLLIVFLGLASVPAFAGSAVIGSVAGSMNSTVGGQPLLPNSVIFSGDTLKVKDGATVVAISNGSRLVFGRETEASFLRDGNEVTVLLGQGNVSVFDPDSTTGLRVKAADLSIVSTKGFKTLGEVAMLNGAVMVTVKEGSLRVEGNGSPVEVTKGKTITIQPKSARAPQGGGAQKLGGGGNTALEAGALGAGVVAAILAGIGISRANDAKTQALAATAAANAANTNAQAATAAANAADADAINATNTANAVGCALNTFNDETFQVPSPFTPASGSC
jgi:hypothetical protein